MIHVCYCLHDETGHYSKFTGTSMLSLFDNTREEVTVHIFHDNTLSETNMFKLKAVADKYDQQIKFYNIDKICPEKIQYLREKIPAYVASRFTIGAFYRLMIEKKFFTDDVNKIIYLDSDTIINIDIAKLWEFSMKRYVIAAVPEVYAAQNYMITNKFLINTGKISASDYFCSGIIVLNLDKVDPKFFYEAIQWLADNPQCECPDQDILNNFFSTTYRKLPPEFNSFVQIELRTAGGVITEKIYHYAGSVALGFDMKNPFDKLFFKYFIKTQWFDLDFIENAYKIMKKIYIECKDFLIETTSIMSGKERAFFVDSNNFDAIKNIFSVQDDEESIIAKNVSSIDELISSMRKSQGKKIYFIVAKYPAIKEKLINAGFIEKQDFIDATAFLSDKHGYNLPIYPLLKYL